jgi:putative DNA methylase
MNRKTQIVPFSLKDAPALIEKLLPAQKLSAETYKEQMAVHGKTLTALGSYWKGRKPLILNKACILGALLPATDDLKRDLEIFEMLMAMDDKSLVKRMKLKDIVLPHQPYKMLIDKANRPEMCGVELHDHIWEDVNTHLGTQAHSMPELVEQLGLMRFGRRPRLADTFCGSGQIPFEAARLGCDVYASDLNPIACMLTWGAFNIIGASEEKRKELVEKQKVLAESVQTEIDRLGIESDGQGARAKVFLYCLEATCPQTGWSVPMLPTLIVSKNQRVVARLVPDPVNKRYGIDIISDASEEQLKKASQGTIKDGSLEHEVAGKLYRTKISTLRGDYTDSDGSNKNRLRQWEKSDINFREDDLYRERLYCIQWQCTDSSNGKTRSINEFRSVTDEDFKREKIVYDHVKQNLSPWQAEGLVPDMVIESGDETDRLLRERGWTHWHHLFNPRQLLIEALINAHSCTLLKFSFTQTLNNNSRLSRWKSSSDQTVGVFDNQALNTLFNFGSRSTSFCNNFLLQKYKYSPTFDSSNFNIANHSAEKIDYHNDIYITDPPYGDAVKYEEILEFFIAWLRKAPPPEFADWTWDSRRTLAIKGEDDAFRKGMIAAYSRMCEKMSDNGLQVIMFTHQSGSIWADMANIVWASGLQVTAAWYVVTETESAIRTGSHVKGTILLVLRKRKGGYKTTRDDLGWEIQEEVEEQVRTLTGLNQEAKSGYHDENLFCDADLQMAGYAAALRVLTKYSIVDGKEMALEALRPRVKGQKTFVDELIEFAVEVANRSLVPQGIEKSCWDKLQPAERFYLKMLEIESQGSRTLDNYQNFSKAFKIKNFKPLMASQKANQARLKNAIEFGRTEMAGEAEFANTLLRGILYALMELQQNLDEDKVISHLTCNIPDFYNQREAIIHVSDYLAKWLESMRPEEASAARILRNLVRNHSIR